MKPSIEANISSYTLDWIFFCHSCLMRKKAQTISHSFERNLTVSISLFTNQYFIAASNIFYAMAWMRAIFVFFTFIFIFLPPPPLPPAREGAQWHPLFWILSKTHRLSSVVVSLLSILFKKAFKVIRLSLRKEELHPSSMMKISFLKVSMEKMYFFLLCRVSVSERFLQMKCFYRKCQVLISRASDTNWILKIKLHFPIECLVKVSNERWEFSHQRFLELLPKVHSWKFFD